MKKKSKKRFLRFDYTTTLVVGTVIVAVMSLGIVGVHYVRQKLRHQNDHKLPLKITNLSYCNGEKLDLSVPQSSKPVPLVMYIHGGGWQYGSKVGGSLNLVQSLVEQQFAVASINYRLSGVEKFPAQINDVFCAVRFLRTKAHEYNINSQEVGLIGISAGAHLAVLAANSAGNPAFTSGAYAGVSNNVQAAIGVNGLYDLTADNFDKNTSQNIQKLLGSSDVATKKAASPLSQVTKYAPAELLIYSLNDKQVNPTQTTNYAAAARAVGAQTELLKVSSADHNLRPYLNFSTKPSRDQIDTAIRTFFIKQLKN